MSGTKSAGLVKVKNLKPGLRNISISGVIVEFIDDPPQSATEIRNFRYHYRFADSGASVELAVPHGILQDIISKASSVINVVSGHNIDLVDEFLCSNDDDVKAEGEPGCSFREGSAVAPRSDSGIKSLGGDFEEDSDWCCWSDDEKESLKWTLQPGDVIFIKSAITTWSHGHMVLVPNENSIEKVGEFSIDFSLEPDMSKQFKN
ncbi:conserved hypothetical protein [Theileria equi strain WA]|uniref:Uncharacterized protein n=1 Tax=Theileria equi strain WA TaxID=1537102 RepID=L1LDP0_THEEQ|nr:conserved hypothetical protein [Theileria equi strain WA]EKX73471.1 conserved hypothetical protein [Theileria equi strain WA]|eukprot:XP_004832923.1 conserved hypothetical protein [Theileria equi strain WA]